MEDKYYTVEVHHSGYFDNAYNYVRGTTKFYDNVDPDMMSYLEVEDMLERLALDLRSEIFYIHPNGSAGTPIQLKTDRDVIDMFEAHVGFSVVKVYVVEPAIAIDVNDNEAVEPPVNGDEDETVEGVMNGDSDVDTNDDQLEELDDDSVYAPSDELCSLNSSDSEYEVQSKRTEQFILKRDLDKKPLVVGQKFACASDFRTALREHSFKNLYGFKFKKNEKIRVTAVCVKENDGCGWRIHASLNTIDKSFEIRRFKSHHDCPPVDSSRQLTSTVISNKYINKFRVDPTWKFAGVQGCIKDDFKLNVSRYQVIRAKKKALKVIEGSYEDQFSKVREYGELLLRTDPDAVVKVKSEPDNEGNMRFKRMFVSLSAMWRGFKEGCRPFVGLDGCFLKHHYNGELLCAVGRDGNNSFFPIALAVVESESKDSWMWFVEELMAVIGPPNGMTFISDRQKGLVDTLEQLSSVSDHRFCTRHLYENFKKKWSCLMLKYELWGASNSFTYEDFETHMERVKALNSDAFEWLNKIPYYLWSKCGFSHTSKCDLNSNNMCESWNSQIVNARKKPIIYMFEMIRRYLMKRFHRNREYMQGKTGLLCPKIQEEVDQLKRQAKKCHVEPAGGGLFEVDSHGLTDAVDLGKKTCTCKQWEISDVPCKHAIACVVYMRGVIEEYVDPYFYRETYLRAYGHIIKPMSLRKMVLEDYIKPMLPPIPKNRAGRPKTARRRAPDESSKQARPHKSNIRCGKCNKIGHNTRTCKSDAVVSTPPVSRGGKPSMPIPVLFVGRGKGRVDGGRGGRSAGSDGGRGARGGGVGSQFRQGMTSQIGAVVSAPVSGRGGHARGGRSAGSDGGRGARGGGVGSQFRQGSVGRGRSGYGGNPRGATVSSQFRQDITSQLGLGFSAPVSGSSQKSEVMSTHNAMVGSQFDGTQNSVNRSYGEQG